MDGLAAGGKPRPSGSIGVLEAPAGAGVHHGRVGDIVVGRYLPDRRARPHRPCSNGSSAGREATSACGSLWRRPRTRRRRPRTSSPMHTPAERGRRRVGRQVGRRPREPVHAAARWPRRHLVVVLDQFTAALSEWVNQLSELSIRVSPLPPEGPGSCRCGRAAHRPAHVHRTVRRRPQRPMYTSIVPAVDSPTGRFIVFGS